LMNCPIPYSNSSVEFYLETDTHNMIKDIVLDTATKIGRYSLNSSTIRSIVIGENVTSIDSEAFHGCCNLVKVVNLSSIPISVGDYYLPSDARILTDTDTEVLFTDENGFVMFEYEDNKFKLFDYVGNQSEITIPSTYEGVAITNIREKVFANNVDIVNVSIPSSVTEIGSSAFSGCVGLLEISISDSITTVQSSAFEGCTNLSKVIINDLDKWVEIDFADSLANPLTISENAKLYLSTDLENPLTDLNITTATKIGSYVFYDNTTLTEIVIPENVTSIGYSSFANCTNLTSIKLNNNLITIGGYAFSGCSKITEIIIPENVETIGGYAFSGCIGLTEVIIPNGVETLGSYVFNECSNLTNITLGEGLTTIGAYAFFRCVNLQEIVIPDSVTSLGANTFWMCYALQSVKIGDGVVSLLDSVFANCTALTDVIIGTNVNSINSRAFNGCKNLESVIFNNTEGWAVSKMVAWQKYDTHNLSSEDLSDASIAATYLGSTYNDYNWARTTSETE